MLQLTTVIILLHYAMATVAFAANVILLIIIFLNTPKPIRTYSVLIMNYVLTDLCTSIAQVLTIPRISCILFLSLIKGAEELKQNMNSNRMFIRLVIANHSFAMKFYGVCTKVNPSFCYYAFLVETFGFSHGLNSVLLSVTYRYFSLRYGVPKRRPIIMVCIVACIPSLIPMLILWQKWSSESRIRELIHHYRNEVYEDHMVVAGIDDASDLMMQCVFSFYLLLWFPIIITINIFKKKMYALVRSHANILSSETLRLHSNLIQAITTQSLTPFLHLITYVCFIVDQYIYVNTFAEIFIFMPLSMLTIVTPLINLYYIRPYRDMFKRCMRYRYQSQGVSVSRISEQNK